VKSRSLNRRIGNDIRARSWKSAGLSAPDHPIHPRSPVGGHGIGGSSAAGLPLAQSSAACCSRPRSSATSETTPRSMRVTSRSAPCPCPSAPASRSRRRGDRPCRHLAGQGSGQGRRAGGPNPFGAPRRGLLDGRGFRNNYGFLNTAALARIYSRLITRVSRSVEPEKANFLFARNPTDVAARQAESAIARASGSSAYSRRPPPATHGTSSDYGHLGCQFESHGDLESPTGNSQA
jgi:hypothetical protein